MALLPRMSDAGASAAADAVARLLDSGYCRIYSGTQAADANTAVGAQVLLAELRFSATSAPAAVAGVITFNTLTSDSSADATGTATWYRALKSDGTTVVMDGSVGTSGTNMTLNSVAIQQSALVSITSFTTTISET